VSGYAELQQTGKSPESWSGVIKAQTPATVQLSLAWFPAWSVSLDGKPIVSRPADNSGLLRFEAGPGEHRVSVRWTRTPAMWVGDVVSLLALCILVAAAVPSKRAASITGKAFEPVGRASSPRAGF
jgi:hypothetical protein